MTVLRSWLILCLALLIVGCEETADAPAPPTTAPSAAATATTSADSDAAPADRAKTADSEPADSGATATGGVIDTPSSPD